MKSPTPRPKASAWERPTVAVDAPAVARLRSEGASGSQMCRELGVSKASAQRAVMSVASVAQMQEVTQ